MAKTTEDVEDRRRRLRLARAQQGLPEFSRGAVSRFAAGTSRGVAKTLGAPVDLVSGLLKLTGISDPETQPLGGSENLMAAFDKLNVGVPSDEDLGPAGRAGEVVGASTVGTAGVAGAGIRSAANAPLIREPRVFTNIIESAGQNFVRNPATAFAVEGSSAVGAGVGSAVAMDMFPDSPGAQMIGEIIGGFSPLIIQQGARLAGQGLMFASERMPITGRAIRGIRNSFEAVVPKGAAGRAKARVERATPDIGASRARVDRTDVLPDSGLTEAQRAGDPGLLSLERDIMEQSAELQFKHARQLATTNAAIRDSLVVEAADEVPTHQVKAYMSHLIDERIRVAAMKADDSLAALGTRATREDVNRLARRELELALRASRAQEASLYAKIPGDARAPTMASQEVYNDIRFALPRAQQDDIPEIARKFLQPARLTPKGAKPNPNFFGDEIEVSELRGLQSKLREEARIARADNRFNRARIADEIADAVTDDIANTVGAPETREAVDVATAFSKDFNDRFTRGPVAKLLGRDRAGSFETLPGLTLESSVGARGPRAREATDALLDAVNRHGDVPAMRGHIEDFLTDDFRRAAVFDNRVSEKDALRWMQENRDVMARFPELRREIGKAIQQGQVFTDTQRLADPRVSRAAVFIDAPPGTEIQRVIETSDPAAAMQDLMKLAANDKSGEATRGLKTAFFEMLLKRSELPQSLDVSEVPFVSGRRLSDELARDTVKEAMRALFKPEEIRRIDTIRQTALLLDNARAAPRSAEGIIGDQPGKIIEMLGRVFGAQFGRVLARNTGGGTVQTPGILAAESRRLLQSGVQDPARRLLTDAVTDPDKSLFRALLIEPVTEAEEKIVRARINAWVIDVLQQQRAIEEDTDE